jgi:KDO2-lipid IV(A) lauroyltransferase
VNQPPALRSEFFINPKYWTMWIGLAAMWCVARLPYGLQSFIGRRIGTMLRLALKDRRAIAWTNLGLCFPELSDADRRDLLRRHFESLGMGMVETAMCWWTPAERLRPLVEVEGLEHLHRALERGKGVILLSAHFTTTEIGARLLHLFIPFHASYRKHNNPLFETVMRRAREAHCETAIPRGDIRAFLRSLKQNVPVWYAPDQNYNTRFDIVFAPFFGVPAATVTATSRLTQMSGAPVVPYFPRRHDDGSGYSLRIHPALNDFPTGDAMQDTARINRLIEDAVREAPAQYLWVHRRFKTRPPGEPYLYTVPGKYADQRFGEPAPDTTRNRQPSAGGGRAP